MKPIATVHWIKDGKEKEKAVYDEKGLYRIMTILHNSKLTYWVCMSSVRTKLPFQPFPNHMVNGQPKPIDQYFKSPVKHA